MAAAMSPSPRVERGAGRSAASNAGPPAAANPTLARGARSRPAVGDHRVTQRRLEKSGGGPSRGELPSRRASRGRADGPCLRNPVAVPAEGPAAGDGGGHRGDGTEAGHTWTPAAQRAVTDRICRVVIKSMVPLIRGNCSLTYLHATARIATANPAQMTHIARFRCGRDDRPMTNARPVARKQPPS